MKAHKHAAMIKAKADDMDLVLFGRYKSKDVEWEIVSYQHLIGHDNYDHFLCLPQHKEACLHWLNGGEIQEKGFYNECEFGKIEIIGASKWNYNHIFMDNSSEFRIKPRKEKRWICVTDNLEIEDGTLYESYADADENSPGYKQIVEIEVEV